MNLGDPCVCGHALGAHTSLGNCSLCACKCFKAPYNYEDDMVARIASARAETKFVADTIDASPFATDVEIVERSTIIRYRHDGKTFHLTIHDMTGLDK